MLLDIAEEAAALVSLALVLSCIAVWCGYLTEIF